MKAFAVAVLLILSAQAFGQRANQIRQPAYTGDDWNAYQMRKDFYCGYFRINFQPVKDQVVEDYLAGIMGRLQKKAPAFIRNFRYRIILVKHLKSVAESCANGDIYVAADSITAMGIEDVLAAIIGHEMAHAALFHSFYANRTNADLNASFQAFLRSGPGEEESEAEYQKYQDMFRSLLKAQEVEADIMGIKLAVIAGYNPATVGWFLLKLDSGDPKRYAFLKERAETVWDESAAWHKHLSFWMPIRIPMDVLDRCGK